MERDFMGLGTKSNPVTIKEEVTDSCNSKDYAPMKGSGIQWSFSNKVSAIPQFLSFKSTLEDKPRKAVHDPIAPSSGFMSILTADAYDSTQKTYPGMVQKSMAHDKQARSHYAVTTTYGTPRIDAYPVNRPQDARIFPISSQQNQTITVSMSSPILQPHFPSTGHNIITNSVVSKPLGGVPVVTTASALPTSSSVIGTTELRDGAKSSKAPAQLTIFYAGSVCVYDDVSPEKAQAIMYLAGNGGSSGTQNKPVSAPQSQALIPKACASDVFVGNKTNVTSPCSGIGNKTYIASPCSGIPSPISVTSSSPSDLATVKPLVSLPPPAKVVSLVSSAKPTEAPKPISSVGTSSATRAPAVAVPQARKASLARFLEKRKERVMNAGPYNVSKKSPENRAQGPDTVSLSMNSSSSFPLAASN